MLGDSLVNYHFSRRGGRGGRYRCRCRGCRRSPAAITDGAEACSTTASSTAAIAGTVKAVAAGLIATSCRYPMGAPVPMGPAPSTGGNTPVACAIGSSTPVPATAAAVADDAATTPVAGDGADSAAAAEATTGAATAAVQHPSQLPHRPPLRRLRALLLLPQPRLPQPLPPPLRLPEISFGCSTLLASLSAGLTVRATCSWVLTERARYSPKENPRRSLPSLAPVLALDCRSPGTLC